MSLMVYPYLRDKDLAIRDLTNRSQKTGWKSAGTESYRKSFYASAPIAALGCRLVPLLADGDLYAEDDDLTLLESEANTILAHLPSIGPRCQAPYSEGF